MQAKESGDRGRRAACVKLQDVAMVLKRVREKRIVGLTFHTVVMFLKKTEMAFQQSERVLTETRESLCRSCSD